MSYLGFRVEITFISICSAIIFSTAIGLYRNRKIDSFRSKISLYTVQYVRGPIQVESMHSKDMDIKEIKYNSNVNIVKGYHTPHMFHCSSFTIAIFSFQCCKYQKNLFRISELSFYKYRQHKQKKEIKKTLKEYYINFQNFTIFITS